MMMMPEPDAYIKNREGKTTRKYSSRPWSNNDFRLTLNFSEEEAHHED